MQKQIKGTRSNIRVEGRIECEGPGRQNSSTVSVIVYLRYKALYAKHTFLEWFMLKIFFCEAYISRIFACGGSGGRYRFRPGENTNKSAP